MTREEIKAKLNELLGMSTPENQGRASEILTGLSDEIERVFTESETANSRVQELTANNETLRAVNAKLFLKVGATAEDISHNQENKENHNQNEEIPSFDKLFNDKGELL